MATSSAALAFVLGSRDMGTISRDDALAHAETIVSATALPVQGDFENGFGNSPEDVAETVRLSAEAGLAGISIEDAALPEDRAYPFDAAGILIAGLLGLALAAHRWPDLALFALPVVLGVVGIGTWTGPLVADEAVLAALTLLALALWRTPFRGFDRRGACRARLPSRGCGTRNRLCGAGQSLAHGRSPAS